ncbi:jupiter microtubule associated homolog 1a [Corythoichthys intestinalis]|uniref:jupiter microtubule associated homolog 1a n=1 Tax=Corythoichthys intestinalis TaxID=161448 RepID=UPI0025A5E8FE|nr:jupiter microtubule associated homolog 1a [Corythoichthys intestinalis]XP_061792484.1 jupiter microtubule associated homolog 1-like [Nerophis lumbriciformis]
MTTTTTYQGMEPGAKNSSRVLRPPGGASNISFGADDDKPPARKDKMASSVFAEPEDPYANRRNNPPGGKPTGVLCGESSAPLRRGATNAVNSADAPSMDGDTPLWDNGCDPVELATAPEREDDTPPAEDPSTGQPSGRRNPPGGKSSLILG